MKTVEEGAEHLWLQCRSKRISSVDTLGIPLSIYVTPADVRDTEGREQPASGPRSVGPASQEDLV